MRYLSYFGLTDSMSALFDKRGNPINNLASMVNKKEIAKMNQDVIKTARTVCPNVKAEIQRVKPLDIEVLWPADKKSAECLIKAIDKLLQQSTGVQQTLLSKYKLDIRDRFKI